MSNSTDSADFRALGKRLQERATQISHSLEPSGVAPGEMGACARAALGLAAAAAVLGQQELASAAAAAGRVLSGEDGAAPAERAGLQARLTRLAGEPGVPGAERPAPAAGPLPWLAVRDPARAALAERALGRLGAPAPQRLDGPAAVAAQCPGAPAGVLLSDFLPDCLPALHSAGWRVIVLGDESSDESGDESSDERSDAAQLAALAAGAERYLAPPTSEERLTATLACFLPPEGGTAVLVVDDDALSRDARSAVLSEAGFRVRAVAGPEQLPPALREATPAVLLVDTGLGALPLRQVLATLGSEDEALPAAALLVGTAPPGAPPALAADAPPRDLLAALGQKAAATRERARLSAGWWQEREQRLREHRIIDAHCLVSMTDRAGAITFANDQFCEVSGYRREELIGQTHRLVKSGEHEPAFYEDLWRTISGGDVWRGLICNRRKDGRLYWVLSTIAPYEVENGRPRSYVSLRTEVTRLKLLQEEMHLKNRALDEATDGVTIADMRAGDARLIYVNPAFAAITGYSADEALGRNCRFLQNGDRDQPGLVELRRALDEQQPVSVVLRNYRKDGSPFWNELHLSPLFDEGGRLSHYIGVQHDISKRVADEEALRESEENLRAVLDAIDDEVLAVDEERRTIFHGARGGPLSLFTPESLTPGAVPVVDREALHTQVRQPGRFEERLEAIYARPELPSEDTCERTDGRVIERTSMPLHRDGRIAGRVWHFRDVTRLHEVQRRMETYQRRLQLGQKYANIGTWDWNITTGELFWTERIAPLFGYPEGELETSFENFQAALHPDDRESVLNAINASIEGDAPYRCEHRVVWPDGTVRWLSETGAVVRDERGEAVRMLGVVQDIDDRKRAEIELVATREEAERANRAKSDFLSSMSHELRTPMNAVLGFAQILQYDESLDECQVENVTEIIRAGNHLLSLINTVLDLAKVESGHIDLSLEVVELHSIVEECMSLIRPIAAKKAIAITQEVAPRQAVRADRMRLKQALLNLLSNGVKYNRDEGRLTLSVVEDAGTGSLQIRVADTGRGLREAEIERIFQPFERLGDRTSGIEGSGIGLTITRRIVEMMGGTIGVASEPGRGSTFWIELAKQELPATAVRAGATTEAPAAAPEVAAASGTRRIIYIEDNPSNIRLMVEVLSRRPGIRLKTAHNADLGIELALSEPPDLILLDINLPGLDGYQVLRILKSEDSLKDIPVLALSANAMPKDIDRGRQAGFAEYITKPLQLEYFLKTLDHYLGTEPGNKQD
ncbi:MAG: PAS domain-containing protein [Pseudohaliea sp.]